ncbi:DnaA regulatory inactivator Hda [Rickettsiella endosymbiont of Litargus connexus]|jgi:DnaA family protein|uniref:DnaA regulatory inactivator Hda n=1 Tax=Rickettsiella endosymbiont of Litargus connexus TaxID=3066237 RepID=UPI00376F146A|nr:DnaA regulatory inactivator Hda [Gammaproteobacteria bacterium]MDD4892427.1 DnaA regulatory inactivator Hda [Candidatus Rickettsiella isopodorum]MDD5162218.1 DnaA regulatory inactivator Hda [Candidatus Rickettsiella isopodorum]
MSTQLILPIQPPDAHCLENFYTGQNAILLNCLRQFSLKIGEPYIYIWGNPGAGCTHLLQACCHAAQQEGFSVAYLPLNTIKKNNSSEMLRGLESVDMVCIDELDSIVDDSIWQESLFHFYNRLQEQSRYLLIAAKHSPNQLNFSLPDLISRLSSGVLFQVRELNDAERLIALQQRAYLRGLELSEEVGQFLLLRLPRDSQALFSALTQLDKASLSLKRKLTIPLVKTILKL